MTAEGLGGPGGKTEDRTVMPAGTGAPDNADSPAWRRSVEAASQHRLKRFREEHLDVEIVSHGYWQAVIPQANGEMIITRWDLGELLDKLDDVFAAWGAALERVDVLWRPQP
jgi:hypothetical protein